MIAAECEPWAKIGGLGDVVDALARALPQVGAIPADRGRRRGAGLDRVDAPVDVFLPLYRGVELPPGEPDASAVRVADPLADGGTVEVRILTVAAAGYRLRLVDHPPAFDRDGIYGHPDDAWRFAILARAALAVLRADAARGEAPVDVLHLHDWHAAAALLDRAGSLAGDPVVDRAAALLTILNLAHHGWVQRRDLWWIGLSPGDGLVDPDAAGIDLLWDGIERAELVNTVSPSFAAETLTGLGFGLEGTLRAKGDRYLGILNGIDTKLWYPAADADLAGGYSRADRTGKAACRRDVLGRLGLDATDPAPVLATVSRLDWQKGVDLILDAAPRLLGRGVRLIVQGSGDPSLAARLRALAAARPYEVAFVERFDRSTARRIYAGADAFLMPSRFEPCGLSQMIALRYGAPPIVHSTGGLRDTVVDEHDHRGEGTGFAFRNETPEGLAWACDQAIDRLEARELGPEGWDAIVDRGMAVDFDWVSGSAPRYLEAYRRAIALRRGAARSPARATAGLPAKAPRRARTGKRVA